MTDTVIETTAKVQAQQQERLINAELAHRIQNILAIVNSISRSNVSRSWNSLDEARTAFSPPH